ncbi:nitrilase-related carbon-nitrogen hydrolase [Streptomyces anulatus]
MKIAAGQFTCAPADVSANVHEMVALATRARESGAELVVFPELALTGYELDAVRADPSLWVRTDDPRLDAILESGIATVVNCVGATEGLLNRPSSHPAGDPHHGAGGSRPAPRPTPAVWLYRVPGPRGGELVSGEPAGQRVGPEGSRRSGPARREADGQEAGGCSLPVGGSSSLRSIGPASRSTSSRSASAR